MVKKILCSSFVLFHRLPDICCVRSSWWTKSSFTEPPYYWSPGRELRPEWSSRWRQKFRAREDLPLTIHLVVAFVKSHLWRQRPRVIKARRFTKHFIVSSCDSQLLGTEWICFWPATHFIFSSCNYQPVETKMESDLPLTTQVTWGMVLVSLPLLLQANTVNIWTRVWEGIPFATLL